MRQFQIITNPDVEGKIVTSQDNKTFGSSFAILNDDDLKGSGVLIAPNIIITARHVADQGNVFAVTNELNARLEPYTIGSRLDEFIRTRDDDIIDLAFILLRSSLKQQSIKLANKDEVKIDIIGTIVGYGINHENQQGIKCKTNIRITNDLPDFGNDSLLVKTVVMAPSGEKDGINFNDSGCPLYIIVAGEMKLAGVATNTIQNGRRGRFINVSVFDDQINKIIQKYPPNNIVVSPRPNDVVQPFPIDS